MKQPKYDIFISYRHDGEAQYALLPDSEKEYDRLMAMSALRLVRRLGFEIVKSNDSE